MSGDERDIQAEAQGLLPITILTGFLGSGKTTLLNGLLTRPELAGALVMINEYGAVALDHLLVRQISEDVVLLESGCICCTVRGDLVHHLHELFIKRVKGEVPEFDRVIVETTGLADPAPIVHTLMSDQMLAARYRLDGILCTVDAVVGMRTLDSQRESVKQAAMADRLILTKSDLADPVELELLRARLARLAPAARQIVVRMGDANPDDLLNCGLFDGRTRIPDVAGWLNDEAVAAAKGADHVCGPGCGHDHHHHDHGHDHAHAPDSVIGHLHGRRHDQGVASFVVTFDQPIAWQSLALAMEVLISMKGENLLRVKGIVNARESDKPLVLHGVQHLFHEPVMLPAWPDEDRRTRIVFITRDLPESSVRELLAHAGEQ